MKTPSPRQLSSGNWFVQLRIGGRSISITEPTQEKCLARALAIKTGLFEQRRNPVPMTLGEACDAYISLRENVCSPTTLDGYRKIRQHHFQELMKRRIDTIDERVLSAAVAQECRRPARRGAKLSPKTIKSALSFVRSVLGENGIQLGRVVAPEVKRKVIRLPDPALVVRAVQGSPVELPCLLAAWLSLSMSEIRGLTKSRSLLDGKLYVVDTVVRVRANISAKEKAAETAKKRPYEDIRKEGGKEEERSRVLSVPDYLSSLISQVPGDVIVPLSISQIEKGFQKCLAAAGLPHMTFHQLRHLNASTMAMLGIQKEIAQERGGWKTPYTMESVYTHTFTAPRQAADQAIDQYFSGLLEPKNANKNANTSKKRRIYRLFKNG